MEGYYLGSGTDYKGLAESKKDIVYLNLTSDLVPYLPI
jgi:hypothetical protein